MGQGSRRGLMRMCYAFSPMRRVFLTVTIDCECDKGTGWHSQKPLRFAGVLEGMGARLQPLFRARSAKPTYLLSPEVMRDPGSVDLLRTLQGDAELGTHLHGEYAEPDAFEPDVTRAFQREYPYEVERAKLLYITDLFRRAFGREPRSFRAGRFGIGPHTIGILDSLGYRVDSSVTPNVDWSGAGAPGLCFRGAPTQPYRPDPKRPERAGSSCVLEVPVTIRRHALAPFVGGLAPPQWLRPTRGTAKGLVAIARAEIAAAARSDRSHQPTVLNAMLHNVEVVANASPYARNDTAARAILARLDALLAFAQTENIPVVGLADIAEHFA
jgi:hypothetical protein